MTKTMDTVFVLLTVSRVAKILSECLPDALLRMDRELVRAIELERIF